MSDAGDSGPRIGVDVPFDPTQDLTMEFRLPPLSEPTPGSAPASAQEPPPESAPVSEPEEPFQLRPEAGEWVKQALDLPDEIVPLLQTKYDGLVTRDDLIAQGRKGLLEATRTYDPTSGTRFRTFAWRHVYGAMMDMVQKESAFRSLQRAAAHGMCDVLEGPKEEVEWGSDTLEDAQERCALFADTMLVGMLLGMTSAALAKPADEQLLGHEPIALVRQALGDIHSRHAEILDLHYLQGKTLSEAQKEMRLTSYPAARRLHDKACRALAVRLRALGFRPR